MLAVMHGKNGCVEKLIQAGANVCLAILFFKLNHMDSLQLLSLVDLWNFFGLQILMFDSLRRRTCLHHAAYYGHTDCLKAILSAAHSSPVASSWLDSF